MADEQWEVVFRYVDDEIDAEVQRQSFPSREAAEGFAAGLAYGDEPLYFVKSIEAISDWLVTTAVIVTLRVENMPEEMAAPHWDDKWKESGLRQRLLDAVEGTDFYLTIDLSDTEVEAATN